MGQSILNRENCLNILIIFSVALVLRLFFWGGFALGDDVEELGLTSHFAIHGVSFFNHLTYRFGIWIWNFLLFKIFGISEITFFLPSVLFSCLIPVFVYSSAKLIKYRSSDALFAGLFVASSPFEVLLGTLRANDTFLAFFIALGIFCFFFYRDKACKQAFWLAFLLWVAFYVKLWVVFFFPIVAYYYLKNINNFKPAVFFVVVSAVLHFSIGFVWIKYYDTLFPYLKTTSATYPVDKNSLIWLWKIYPKIIFWGSEEFNTTLFGSVGWMWGISIVLFVFNKIFNLKLFTVKKFDGLDWAFLGIYLSFFILLNFLPHNFKIDVYYSVPRIFRYLAPFSFALSAHLALLICRFYFSSNLVKYFSFFILLLINIYFCHVATRPTKSYHQANIKVASFLKELPRTTVLMESWISTIFRDIYLKNIHNVPGIHNIHEPKNYEEW